MHVIFIKVPFPVPPTVFWRQNRPSFVDFRVSAHFVIVVGNDSVLISLSQDMWKANLTNSHRDKITDFVNEYFTIESVAYH